MRYIEEKHKHETDVNPMNVSSTFIGDGKLSYNMKLDKDNRWKHPEKQITTQRVICLVRPHPKTNRTIKLHRTFNALDHLTPYDQYLISFLSDRFRMYYHDTTKGKPSQRTDISRGPSA